jgi:hypothetical protein
VTHSRGDIGRATSQRKDEAKREARQRRDRNLPEFERQCRELARQLVPASNSSRNIQQVSIEIVSGDGPASACGSRYGASASRPSAVANTPVARLAPT